MKISNWGNYPTIDSHVSDFTATGELKQIISSTDNCISRGLGRCYGDSALNETIASTINFKRFLGFDANTGILTCESGVSLYEILDIFVPQGWFLAVTPGTKYVSVGGAIASDVHGKNHHKSGSFSSHLLSMDILLSKGEVVSCSRDENPELFWNTCGGMGLTGVILKASIQLVRIETTFIRETSIRAGNLEEIMRLFENSEDWTYSVAWIDCLAPKNQLGRSILMLGEHAKLAELDGIRKYAGPMKLPNKMILNVPMFFPNFTLNSLSIKAFNGIFYHKHYSRKKEQLIDYDSYFYPLDSILNWNRMYGRQGFTQYQMEMPLYWVFLLIVN